MKTIVMKESAKGSSDGLTVQTFGKGEQYNVSDDLFNSFVKIMKVAEEYVDKKKAPQKKKEDIAEKAVSFYKNKSVSSSLNRQEKKKMDEK